MEKKIEAVIFDWAGTTVDYGCFAPVQAFIEAFKEFGITPTIEEVRAPMGMLKRDHIKTMMEMPRIKEAWDKIYKKNWDETDVDMVYQKSEASIMSILKDFADPKPYVLEIVAKLKEKGIKIGSTTGYTDEMMSIVVPKAKENGYEPDFWCSANSVRNMGRPYPYMIFKNLEALKVTTVDAALKVGDTVSDIIEGKHAGMITAGIIEGSSIMALSKDEYEKLSEKEKKAVCQSVRKIFIEAGADYVFQDIRGVLELI